MAKYKPRCVNAVRKNFFAERDVNCKRDVQGGPAKVRPTYIFGGNI